MPNKIELPDDVARLKRCKKAGFSAKQAENMVKEFFQSEGKMNDEVKNLSERMDNRFNELIAVMKAEMASKSEVAAAVAEASKDRMTQFMNWGIAIVLAVLAFIGGTFVT